MWTPGGSPSSWYGNCFREAILIRCSYPAYQIVWILFSHFLSEAGNEFHRRSSCIPPQTGMSQPRPQPDDRPGWINAGSREGCLKLLAVRPCTHAANYLGVLFYTNRVIVELLGKAGFPVSRIPVAMQGSAANGAGRGPFETMGACQP